MTKAIKYPEPKNKRTYGKLCFSDNQWIVEECEPHVSIRLKDVFKKISIVSRPPFKFANTLDFCEDMSWFMQRYPFEISKKDLRLLNSQKRLFEKNIAELERILLPDVEIKNPHINFLRDGCTPRNYQVKTTQILEKVKGTICGDDLGLGKTFTGMTACLNPKNLPCAIVVETHLPQQWVDNFTNFTKLDTHIIKTKKMYNLPKAHIYIFKYSNIAGWTDFFTTGFFKMAIYDEVQNLRTGTNSAKGEAAKILSEYANLNLGMSHTPIFNYASELWHIYNIISPDSLGDFYEFTREWGDGGYSEKVIIKDPKALGTYLRENYLFIKNTRKSVGRELPPVETVVHEIEHDETLVKDHIELAQKLSQTLLTTTDFTEAGKVSRDLDRTARQMTGIAKAKSVANFVKILLDNDEPVILAGWHREVYRIWLEELKHYSPLMFTGSETPKQKEENKKAFLNGESKLLIMSLRSGAGTDGLQEVCKTIVIGEPDWASGVHEQLIGRLHRDGQDDNVMAFFLFSTFGSDPTMREVLGLKASQARGIFNPDGGIVKTTNNQQRLRTLATNILNTNTKNKVEDSSERTLFD